MIAGRIRRLPDDARAVAQVAAVFGGAFDLDALREAGGWHEYEVSDAIDVLLDHGIVRAGTHLKRPAHAFSHDLIRASIYEQTPEVARRLAHRRAARAIVRLYPDLRETLASELAVHYERAGMPAQSAAEYLVAARRANAVFANDDTVRLTTSGLALEPELHVRFG
ncbi:MAG: 6-hydroxy-D-nicotine oxidase, partial [Candidatus Velthaea sp.]